VNPSRSAIAALFIASATIGCGRAAREQARARTASLEQALRPTFFAGAFRKMGGGHFHATTRFVITPDGDAPDAAGTTTATNVWLDRAGNYRLSETNDRDGGREVVLFGRELSTALRYGKMIRRVAEEPEPTQLLEEALGGPWAAWEVVAQTAAIEPGPAQLLAGASAADYRISKGEALVVPAGGELRALRKWRGTVAVQTLGGDMLVDERSGALVKADLTAAFTLTEDNRPMKGAVEVHAVLTDAAALPPIERPPAEELALRQRIVPEQKEMLRGLGGRVPPPPVPPPPSKKKKGRK
jgi:hypothetical protein